MADKDVKKETDPLIAVEAQAVEVFEDEPAGNGSTEEESSLSFGTRLGQVVTASFQLGLTAFGDTNLKIALIEQMVVEQQQWVDYETFMELFGLSQALPGPLATQCLLSCAMVHAGPLGALLALCGWILPGTALLTMLGLLVNGVLDTDKLTLWLAGVAPATVALVIYASATFAHSLDKFQFALATLSCVGSLYIDGDATVATHDTKYAFPLMLAAGGLLAVLDATLLGRNSLGTYEVSTVDVQKVLGRINLPIWGGLMILQLWFILLLLGIILANLMYSDNTYVWIYSRFFRIGSVVFGGEEAVLPMLTTEMVPSWLSAQEFAHGLAVTQAAPGSIFNLAAYIGALHHGQIGGALLAVVSLYMPSYLFLLAGLPIWARLRPYVWFKAILRGVNAVAIGFMGAVCIFLWESSILRASDAMILVVCLSLVAYYKVSAPLVIAVAIVLGIVFNEEMLDIAQKPYNSDPGDMLSS